MLAKVGNFTDFDRIQDARSKAAELARDIGRHEAVAAERTAHEGARQRQRVGGAQGAQPGAAEVARVDDDAVVGTAFYLMEYVDGRILWDPTLPEMTAQARAAHYDELNRVLATLHQVDYAAAGLADFPRVFPEIYRATVAAGEARRSTRCSPAGIATPSAKRSWAKLR